MSTRKPLLIILMLLLVVGSLVSCTSAADQPAADQPAEDQGEEAVELTFAFWGSPQEKEAVDNMVISFEASHPNIKIKTQHIPDAYDEKMTTMLASGTEPDVAYLAEPLALPWAVEGKLFDLTEFFKTDPDASSRLAATYYHYGDDQVLGTNTAGEIALLYYSKDLFDKAGVDYLPVKGSDALQWDDFVELAKKLTFDVNGNDATSPDFDPDNIETFGFTFPKWWMGYMIFLYSNGGGFANPEGTELWLNKPEAVEVLQELQDLIYVHHVAPTPAQTEALPTASVMMETGKVAMVLDGHWKVLDYSQLEDLNWGLGVLPYFKEPETMLFGAPTVIFASTEHPEEAMEFYKFHNSLEAVDLFVKGLWMPLQEEYYTDEAKIKEWIEGKPGVYPPEARDAVVDYTYNYTLHQPPVYWLKNWVQIEGEAVSPALDLLWTGEATAQEAADQAVQDAASMMQGTWTD